VTSADQTWWSSEVTGESYRKVKETGCDCMIEDGIEGRIEGRIRTCAFISVLIAANM
jgi:hypothetical protein